MRNRRYEFVIDGRQLAVEAEQEGNCRYMVRAIAKDSLSPARVRIGYLTGCAREWLAEQFGGNSTKALSAKAACLILAEWATKQSGFPKKAPIPAK